MTLFFGKPMDEWKKLGADKTVLDLTSQPELWLQTLERLEKQEEVFEFVRSFMSQHPNGRIILSGSGSSSFVADIAAPFLHYRKDQRIVSVSAADIVSSPENYLDRKIPTLAIYLTRTANVPEIRGAYSIIKNEVENSKHLLITNGTEGRLVEKMVEDKDSCVFLAPPQSIGESYSSAASFTTLLLSLLMVFENDPKGRATEIRSLMDPLKALLATQWQPLSDLAKESFDRVLFLGTSAFKGVASEGQLALLEMAHGQKNSYSDATLKFRYTKRFVPNANTVIFQLFSSHPYPRQFEEDLLNEIYQNKMAKKVVAISWKDTGDLKKISDLLLIPVKEGTAYPGSGYAALFYVLYLYLFDFFTAVHSGLSPDNPVPYGLNQHEPKRGKDFASFSSFR